MSWRRQPRYAWCGLVSTTIIDLVFARTGQVPVTEIRSRQLAQMRGLHFGRHYDHGGPVDLQRGIEFVGQFFAAVDVDRAAPETRCEGGDVEAWQVQSRHAGRLFQYRERLQDRVFAVAHRDEHDR